MVGGGNRRDDGSFAVRNTNVFAALESLRKKKKSDKEKRSSKGGKSAYKAVAAGQSKETETEKQVYWAPAPLTVKSWADVDDEDEDDYYATTAPPQAVWGGSGLSKGEVSHKAEHVEESESEDEFVVEGDDDMEEEDELDHENEIQERPEPITENLVDVFPVPKEAERQLSKKERRKKELAELEAILADFGVNPKEKSEDEQTFSTAKDKKEGQSNGDEEKNNNVPVETKNAKKKKKKDKASKEVKDLQDLPKSLDAPNEQEGTSGTEPIAEDTSTVGVKELLKKVASSKKKKPNKEMDGAARAAAVEAAARSAKLARAKKKEKNHYNQQPMR